MSSWSERVEDLLYEGETIEEKVTVDTATVFVTSHRVLAFTPELEGDNFRQVDRPNVEGVTLESGGESRFGRLGARAALYGLILIVVGFFLPIDSLVGGFGIPSATGRLGVGGVLGLLRSMLDLLRSLDDIMMSFGALLLLFALVPLGVYLWSRERNLVIEAAGEDGSIRLPAPAAEADALANELEVAILPPGVRTDRDEGTLSSLLSG